MKYLFYLIPVFFLFGCRQHPVESYSIPDWSSRKMEGNANNLHKKSRTYLPVYSQVYTISEERKEDLAATVSIRNTDLKDLIYLSKVDYYNTEGHLIRRYLNSPIFVKPMETIEIVIETFDNEGGTGANFIFEWQKGDSTSKPLFEAVMISTAGQQGISFTTRGVDVEWGK
jgi:hypothetical protein